MGHQVAAGLAALAIAGASVALAAPATADQVWHQSVQRPSAEAACSPSTSAELEAGWSDWSPSWELWANDGLGGWTCTRSIVWARDSGGGPGCLLWSAADEGRLARYRQFGDSWSSPAMAPLWTNATCSGEPFTATDWPAVYAPPGTDPSARCAEAFPATPVAFVPSWRPDPDVYACTAQGQE